MTVMYARAATAPMCSGFTIGQIRGIMGHMPDLTRRQKIIFEEIRATALATLTADMWSR
jgi:hypothetical protein